MIIGLNGFSPWDRPLAIRKVVKMGPRGMDVVLAALDMPYCMTWIKEYIVTSQDFAEVFGFITAHPFLVEMLTEIGRAHFEKLKDNLSHPNLNVRLSVMSAMGKIGNSWAIELLVPFTNSSNVEEQIGAIVSLGELRATSAVDKIILSLRDSNPGVREMGIRALVKINDTKALPALEDIARTDHTVIELRPRQTLANLAEWAIKEIGKANSR